MSPFFYRDNSAHIEITNLREIIMSRDNGDDLEIKDIAFIEVGDNGQYSIQDKQIALMFMEFTVHAKGDDLIPRWEMAKNALNITIPTLKTWWKDRKKIQEAAGNTIDLLPEIMSTKLKFQLLKAIDEVDTRGLRCFSNQDLINFIKTATHISRLLDNKSNFNIALNSNFCDGHVKAK